MPRLYRRLGKDRFLDNCTFPLIALEKLGIDPGNIVIQERVGRRSMTAVLLEAASASARGTGTAYLGAKAEAK